MILDGLQEIKQLTCGMIFEAVRQKNLNMRGSIRLLRICRITLFTRENCSLCRDAKDVLSKVWYSRPFVYTEVDVMKPDQNGWRNLYEFDTPVVC